MLLQNTSLYICSYSKYVVYGLLKIIQNYVNNKINNYFFLVFWPCVSIDYGKTKSTPLWYTDTVPNQLNLFYNFKVALDVGLLKHILGRRPVRPTADDDFEI